MKFYTNIYQWGNKLYVRSIEDGERIREEIGNFQPTLYVPEEKSKYPPYNLIQDGDKYTIELAVAGFTEDDIEIIHEPESGQIIIEGRIGSSEGTYLHQGIANRSFRRIWTVSDSVVVNGAELSGGILRVELESIVPEEKKPKKIAITNSQLLNG